MMQDRQFRDVIDLLPAGTHLVVNESRVFEARLWATSNSADRTPIEVMLLAPEEQAADKEVSNTFDPSVALQDQAHGQTWRAMVRKVVKEGDTMQLLSNSSSKSPRETFIRVARVHSPWEEENDIFKCLGDGLRSVRTTVLFTHGLGIRGPGPRA